MGIMEAPIVVSDPTSMLQKKMKHGILLGEVPGISQVREHEQETKFGEFITRL